MSNIDTPALDQLTGVDDVMYGIDVTTRQIWQHGTTRDNRYCRSWNLLSPLPDGDKASTIYIHTEFDGHEKPESHLRVFTMSGKILQHHSWGDWWSAAI